MSVFASWVAARWPNPGADDPHPGKKAVARLEFAHDPQGRTYLARARAGYPFHVGRALRLEESWPELATVYLQSVSGGLYQGDRLTLIVKAAPGAAAQVTTQASTKVHSMEDDFAVQAVKLALGSDAYLEYLADPLILFPRSRLLVRTCVRLAFGASAVVGDAFLFHDPRQADAEKVMPPFDAFASEVEIADEAGRVLAADRFLSDAPAKGHASPALAAGFLAQGTLYALSRRQEGGETDGERNRAIVAGLRGALEEGRAYGGVSALPNGCGAVARVLAAEGADLRSAMHRLAAAARQALKGRPMAAARK